jgi:hypothetical protein
LHDVLKQDSSSQPPSQLWNNLKQILGPEPPRPQAQAPAPVAPSGASPGRFATRGVGP